MTDPILDQINNLNATELVKDLLRNWASIRKIYSSQIRRYHFSEEDKKELGQLAKKLYQKYKDQQSSAQVRFVWDEGTFKQYFSVSIFGTENYPLLSFPYSFLMVESLNSTIFQQLLQNWPSVHVDLDLFARVFWQERKTIVTFSKVDLQLLKALFTHIETSSCIGVPKVADFWYKGLKFSKSTAYLRYSRLFDLGIVTRRSIINFVSIGLIPLIKIYHQSEIPTSIEMLFSTWEDPFSPDKSLQILAIPPFSSFWGEHSSQDVHRLQYRYDGININLFDGKNWQLNFLPQLVDTLPISGHIPAPLWKMDFTTKKPFPFRYSDLRLLKELQLSHERQIKYIPQRADFKSEGHAYGRLQKLREEKIFQTLFKLYTAGLGERYYLLILGTEQTLLPIYQFICHMPQYYIAKSESCIYALVWLPSELEKNLLEACNHLKDMLGLQKFYYGTLNSNARSHFPNFLELCKFNENGKPIWKSELEWE
ncbi:MAG: hypothetical protein ACFFCZ_09715 [Promethearchaeota archaeon]